MTVRLATALPNEDSYLFRVLGRLTFHGCGYVFDVRTLVLLVLGLKVLLIMSARPKTLCRFGIPVLSWAVGLQVWSAPYHLLSHPAPPYAAEAHRVVDVAMVAARGHLSRATDG